MTIDNMYTYCTYYEDSEGTYNGSVYVKYQYKPIKEIKDV